MRSLSLVLLGALAVSATGQAPGDASVELARKISASLQDRYRRETNGGPGDVWKRPMRLILLFNSSNAQDRSAYTDAAARAAREFLAARQADGYPRTVSFFPYQLDLYTGPAQALRDRPLDADALSRVERLFPRVRFDTLADGTTPYPPRGGHSNLAAREAAGKLLGSGDPKTPTVLIQITDNEGGEAPGSGSDGETRRRDVRADGVEELGLEAYDAVTVAAGTRGQTATAFVYGPKTWGAVLAVAGPVVPQEPRPISAWIWAVPLGLTALAGLAFLGRKVLAGSGGKVSVTVPGNAAVVMKKGETLPVFGPGAALPEGPSAVLRGDGIPAGKLFTIAAVKGGVSFMDAAWKVDGATTGKAMIASGKLTVKDTQSVARLIALDVRAL